MKFKKLSQYYTKFNPYSNGFIHNEKPGLYCIPAICTALLPPQLQNSGMVLEKMMIEVQNTAQTIILNF